MRKYKKPLILSLILHGIIASCILVYIVMKLQPHSKSVNTAKKPIVVSIHATPSSQPRQTNKGLAWLVKKYKNKLHIDHTFKSIANLTGNVVHLSSQPNLKSIIYSDKNGNYAIIGTLFDEQKGNLTALDADKYITAPLNKSIYVASVRMRGLVEGNKKTKHMVTIVIDPNSNIFPLLYKNMQFDIKSGEFAVKWLLVDYLKPDGPNVANAILQAKHPLKALNYNAQHYNISTQTGGYNKELPATKSTKKTLRSHWDFVQKYNLYKLPITVFKIKHNFHVVHGFILDELLENYFGK